MLFVSRFSDILWSSIGSGSSSSSSSSSSLAANCLFWDNHSNGDTSIKFGMRNLLRSSIQKKKNVSHPKIQDGSHFSRGLPIMI